MSVIWSGVTEEGAVVPVQVDETGKVIATAAVPGGDYVKKTGDNMTGSLTLGAEGSPVIALNESNGSASFDGDVNVGDGRDISNNTTATGIRLGQDSAAAGVYVQCKGSTPPSSQIAFMAHAGTSKNFEVKYDGSATFAGDVIAGDATRAGAYSVMQPNGYIEAVPVSDSDTAFRCYSRNQNKISYTVKGDGSATFAGGKCGFTSDGEIFFTSRNARYKLVVQDQLVLAEPYTRQMELKEKAEQFIADKRETKPSDDSQSGVSMDIDNSSPKQD